MDLANFHFIRPLWLFAIIALLITLALLKKYRVQQSGWQSFIPEHLAKVLISTKESNKPLSLITPLIIGLLAIIAMAGPTWKKLPQPVYQVARGAVVIMDLSYSMYATDVSPNRITRARYKVIDLLEEINEGEIGLIAYAGDAFTISPLTEDIKNIHLLLPALSPDIMPVLGSNPLAALTLAKTMLLNAGHIKGDVYWITDGIDNEDIEDINQWSSKNDYTLNILGIGTANGAPIKLTNGELMKDHTGSIIVPKLNTSPLKQVAQKSSGNYITLTNDNDDINALLTSSLDLAQKDEEAEQRESQNIGDQWQDMGAYLIFLILPFIIIYFRRGILVYVLALTLNFTSSQPAYANTDNLNEANSSTTSIATSAWNNLWKTKDQQAQDKFNAQAYKEAAPEFSDPLWQGSAYYKAGEFEKALEAFQQVDSAQSLYNQGNTLAKLQKLDEAIKAYDEALEKKPDLADAKTNKEILEQLKDQQEQNQEQSGDSNDEPENDEKSDSEQQSDDQNNQGDNSDSDSENQDSESQNSENSDSGQDQSPEENSDSDSSASDEKSEEEKEQEAKNKEENESNDEPEQIEDEQSQADQQKKEEQSQAQAATELSEEEAEKAKEMAQKHQKLLKKVTDDPYMLLRNKMQLEYRKRRQNQAPSGVQKQW